MPPQFLKMAAKKAAKPEKGETKKHERAEAKKGKGAKCEKEED
jgi:hypothetical protein